MAVPLQPVRQRSDAPKSILKKRLSPNPPKTTSREDHNRELALHHANLIQNRKDVESVIFESTETLIDFPSETTSDPTQPSPADAIEVKKLLRPFQPSDFDSLIEERNINKKCGYVLCPRLHRTENTSARFRLLTERRGRRTALQVVPTAELEKWCTDDCGKRALFLRVQLSDEPAWERASPSGGNLELHGQADTISTPSEQDLRMVIVTDDLEQLALERGERRSKVRAVGAPSTVGVEVKEREASDTGKLPQPPTLPKEASQAIYDAIEGYLPRLGKMGQDFGHTGDTDEDDIMDTI